VIRIAWDDTKSTGDTLTASEYNALVNNIQTYGTNADEFLGSDGTLTDGDPDRVFTLSAAPESTSTALVFHNGLLLSENMVDQYDISGTDLTIKGKVWDTDNIKVILFS